MPCSLSIYPAVEKSPWNISRGPSIPENLGPWENKQCLATAWLRALGDSEMSLAILARLICWETGLQTHRAWPACLGTTEVWVLRGPHSAAVDLSTAPWRQAAPSLDPDQELRSRPSAQWNATPGLPCWLCPGLYIAIQVLSTSPVPPCPSLGSATGTVGDLRENDHLHPEGPVQGRGRRCHVSEDPQMGKGGRVHQSRPSVLMPAGRRAQGRAKKTQPKSPQSQLPLKPQRSTLLLNNPPWLSPSTR